MVCAQEGEGPASSAAPTPTSSSTPPTKLLAALDEAERRKARLLEFDRTSQKRTVIDDQADYFSHAPSDGWMTKSETAAAETLQQARDEAEFRRRRELRVTLDIANGKVVRDAADAPSAADAAAADAAADLAAADAAADAAAERARSRRAIKVQSASGGGGSGGGVRVGGVGGGAAACSRGQSR